MNQTLLRRLVFYMALTIACSFIRFCDFSFHDIAVFFARHIPLLFVFF